ncbi:MAG: hypothetical protein ACREJ3_05235 [Polyangiaceae bacterium]
MSITDPSVQLTVAEHVEVFTCGVQPLLPLSSVALSSAGIRAGQEGSELAPLTTEVTVVGDVAVSSHAPLLPVVLLLHATTNAAATGAAATIAAINFHERPMFKLLAPSNRLIPQLHPFLADRAAVRAATAPNPRSIGPARNT